MAKICHFTLNHPLTKEEVRLGFLANHTLYDVQKVWLHYFKKKGFFNACERARHKAPNSLYQLLKITEDPLSFIQETIKIGELFLKEGDDVSCAIEITKDEFRWPLSLKRPLDQSGSYRDFYTFETHVKTGHAKRNKEVPKEWYEIPVNYKGQTYNFIGPDDIIPYPSFTNELDFEGEIMAIVAKDGKSLKGKKTYQHLLGYTLLNDISARDLQRKEMAVGLGPSKSKDFCSVIGPYITTIDEFHFDHPNLILQIKVNNTLVSETSSKNAYYSFADMIEFASKEEWLLAGDMIGSGTLANGCGLELGFYLNAGDTISLETELIGTLSNTVGIKHGKL